MQKSEEICYEFYEFVTSYDYDFDAEIWIHQTPVFPFGVYSTPEGKLMEIKTQDDFEQALAHLQDQFKFILSSNPTSATLSTAINVCLHKPYHLNFLAHLWDLGLIDRDTMSTLLIDFFVATEFPHQTGVDTLLGLFRDSNRELLMSDEEKKVFAGLPDKIKIYRGLQGIHSPQMGLSWTTDIKVAHFFAERFCYNGKILEATVPKEAVFSYKEDRGEFEVICDPKFIDL